MKSKKIKKIMLIIILILLVLFIAFIMWLPSFVLNGERQSLDRVLKYQSSKYDTSFYEKLKKEDYVVKGFEDYELHVEYLENPVKTDKYVILTHGYTTNRISSLKFVSMYLELGYNCIIYDLRGHGENVHTFTTYGDREGKDLKFIIDDTRNRYKDLKVLGLHGESIGAATTITSLKYNPSVNFVVADCGFSDIENVLKLGYKNAHVPPFLVDIADFTGKIRYGYSIKAMRPIDSLDENKIPILFIHGGEDSLILPKNSYDMYDRTKGYKEIHIIEKAKHAESIFVSPKEYKEIVKKYLETVVK